jgi:hypothetical protein
MNNRINFLSILVIALMSLLSSELFLPSSSRYLKAAKTGYSQQEQSI